MRATHILMAVLVVVGGCLASDTSDTSSELTGPTLKAIALTPTTVSLFDGGTQQLTVTGFYSDASTRDLTSSATFVSNKLTIATVAAGGVVTAVHSGTAAVTAKVNAAVATTTVAVKVSLTSVAVAPSSVTLPANATTLLAATGTFDNGTVKKLTSGVTWTSNDPTVATVTSSGAVVTIAPGSTTLLATVTGSSNAPVVALVPVTVTGATLTAIAVTPVNKQMAKGLSQQYTASGTYSDGSKATPVVVWASTVPAVASITATGVATGLAIGPTTISATPVVGPTGSTTLHITAAILQTISVTPATATLASGLTQQYAAQGHYSDGTVQDFTSKVTWTSSSASATIAAGGLAHAAAVGSATITGTDPVSKKKATATLTTTPAVLASIALSPVAPSVPAGLSIQLDALGTWTDGSTQNLDATATWSSSSPDVAAVGAGLVTGLAAGTTTITATDPATGVSQSVLFTVTPSLLVSIAITPADPSVPLDTTAQLTATGTYTDGSTLDITQSVSWSSSDTNVAVSNAPAGGVVTALALGDAVITATDPTTNISGETTVTAGPAILVSLAITPNPITLREGDTLQLTATGTMSDGTSVGYTNVVGWGASPGLVVSNRDFLLGNGMLAGTRSGDFVVTATDFASGLQGSATVTVQVRTDDDAAAEFIGFANPVGNWSYGYEGSAGSGFVLSTGRGGGASGDRTIEEINISASDDVNGSILALKNIGSEAFQQFVAHVFIAPGALVLAAPILGSDPATSVCRWTAPIDGTFQIDASFVGNLASCFVGAVTVTQCLFNGCAGPNANFLDGGQTVRIDGTGFLGLGFDDFTCPSNAYFCEFTVTKFGCGFLSTCVDMRMTGHFPGFGCASTDSHASVAVLYNGAPIFAGQALGNTPQLVSTSIHVNAGDTLDFEVGNGGSDDRNPQGAFFTDAINFDAHVRTCGEAGLADCGTSCADTANDTNNCSACGAACPSDPNGVATCTAGACALTCNPGFTDCNGTCVDLTSDPNNCGTCGAFCSTSDPNGTATCTGGTCIASCNAGFTDCGSGCTNEQTDPNNCGACGNVCAACVTGVCLANSCGLVGGWFIDDVAGFVAAAAPNHTLDFETRADGSVPVSGTTVPADEYLACCGVFLSAVGNGTPHLIWVGDSTSGFGVRVVCDDAGNNCVGDTTIVVDLAGSVSAFGGDENGAAILSVFNSTGELDSRSGVIGGVRFIGYTSSVLFQRATFDTTATNELEDLTWTSCP